jgi:hypothetical protein
MIHGNFGVSKVGVSPGPGFEETGVVPLEDSDICEFKALSSDNSANRGTITQLQAIVLQCKNATTRELLLINWS